MLNLNKHLLILLIAISTSIAVPASAETSQTQNSILIGLGEAVNLTGDERNALVKVIQLEFKRQGALTSVIKLANQDDPTLRALMKEKNATRLVSLDATRVGRIIIVLARHSSGSTFRTESIQIKSLEELPVAATRLANAVLQKKSFDRTANYHTLIGHETRKYNKKFGEFLMGVGVNSGTTFSKDTGMSYGVAGKVSYEMDHWRLDSELSFLFSDPKDGAESFLFEWNIGSSYLFSKKEFTPFVSFGLGLSHLTVEFEDDVDTSDYYYDYSDYYYDNGYNTDRDGTGLAAYIGTGVEFFRYHSTRLILDLKVVLPTYALADSSNKNRKWVPAVKSTISFLW